MDSSPPHLANQTLMQKTARHPLTSSTVAQQLRLHTVTSAAFPIGAFTFSHGMETAIADGSIHDRSSCLEWIENIVRYGSIWNDALLLREAWHITHACNSADYCEPIENELRWLNDLALALCSGAERYHETTHMGAAFIRAASTWGDSRLTALQGMENIALPIAMGATGASQELPLEIFLPVSLQASTSNLIWIATRLVPLGQTDSLLIIGQLETVLISIAEKAMQATLDELGSCTLLSDMASIQHEELNSRVCAT
ncbi:MAG: urease accessory protein UreF [Granulosicoccus sp.]